MPLTPTGNLAFSGSAALNIFGSTNIALGPVVSTYSGTITFKSTTTGKTIAITNGSPINSSLIFDGVGGGWTFSTNINVSAGASHDITLVNYSSLDTNGKTVTGKSFTDSSNGTRTLTLGASTFTLSRQFGFSDPTGLTLNAGTSTISVASPNAGDAFMGGGKTYNNVHITAGPSGQTNITGTNTYNNLQITDSATGNDIVSIEDSVGSGTLTITGGNGNKGRVIIQSSTLVAQASLNFASVALTNVDFLSIAATGAAFSGTVIGDLGNNTGITFTTPVTRFWVGNSGNWSSTTHWSASSGGSSGASVPLPQDTAIFDLNSITSAGQTITFDCTGAAKDINFTGVLNNPVLALGSAINTLYATGAITLYSGITTTPSSLALVLLSGNTSTFTDAGVTINFPFYIITVGGQITLQDNLTTSDFFIHEAGTLDLNGFNTNTFLFDETNSATSSVSLGSGTMTLTGSGAVWSLVDNGSLTFNAGTSTVFIAATASDRSFSGGGVTYHNLYYSGAGAGVLDIEGDNTFSDIKFDAGLAGTFTGTQTVNTFTAVGTAGNEIDLSSTNPGDPWFLSKPNGTVVCDYLILTDSHAQGGALWYAGSHSVDNGGNSGWIFADPPTGSTSNFFLVF